jgi:hypothetical protein
LLDQIGGVLPYALIVGVVTYYLLDSRLKRAFSDRIKMPLWFFGVQCLIVAAVMIAVVLLLPFWPSIPGLGLGPPPLSYTVINAGERALNLPVFGLLSLLTIFMIAFPIVALLLATRLRRRSEVIEEPREEEIGSKERWKGVPENTYDEYRRMIIGNYVEGRELMTHLGVPSSDVTTSREFESNVVRSVNEAGRDFVPLTRLFEEARFSVHSMGEPEKLKSEKHRKKLENLTPEPRDK